jgi:protein-tyrosine phosphatase
MGEYLLKKLVKQSNTDVIVASAGLGALVGHGPDELAREVMAEHGIDMSPHRARQLDGKMVRENDLILVMESWHQKEIENHFPFSTGRVHLIGKWSDCEVKDPYKKSKEHFIEAFEKINQSCEEWCKKLC